MTTEIVGQSPARGGSGGPASVHGQPVRPAGGAGRAGTAGGVMDGLLTGRHSNLTRTRVHTR